MFSSVEARPKPHRWVHFLGVAACLVMALPISTSHAQTRAGAAPPPTPTAGRDISGVYLPDSYSAKIQPVGGGDPPYTPAAMATYKKNMAALKANMLSDDARTLCLPDGVPRALASPYPFEIFQSPNRGEIHFLYELNHVVRLVSMDKPMPSAKELSTFPFFVGHSVGHWDGDTLVVQTAGFNDKTYLDNSGAPHTDQLRTVERIRKISEKELEDVVTIHDPGVFTKDWSARFVYEARPDIRIMDYICGEKHRDLSAAKATVVATPVAQPAAQPGGAIPDFSSAQKFWVLSSGTGYQKLPGDKGPGPVMGTTKYQPDVVDAVADTANPILQPWAKKQMDDANAKVIAGGTGFVAASRCWPGGVPGILLFPGEPIAFLQSPKEVVILWKRDAQVRRVYMNVPHSTNPGYSWYGESIGHYENGDTLVVDTIGLDDKGPLDRLRTPHTKQLHVIERYKLTNGGKSIEVAVHVEDPGAFTAPWNGLVKFERGYDFRTDHWEEDICAEAGDGLIVQKDVVPMPRSTKQDF